MEPQQHDKAKKQLPENLLEKWGDAAQGGYQAVPHNLFKFQGKLGLSHAELVTLLNILDHWWTVEKRPYPGADRLAKRMNTNARTVQRHLKSLHDKGYAVRERGEDENRMFNFSGLMTKLAELVRQEPKGKRA